MDTRAWAAWMAVRAATETALRARTTEAQALARALLDERTEFDGHRGIALSFRDADRQLRQPVYVLAPDEDAPDRLRVAATMPPGEPGPGVPSRTFLDRLGAPPPGARCGG
jgi:BMFP domain-containing protein YqiC